MTNPDNAVSQNTIEEKVNAAIAGASKGADGKTKLPEGTPEDVAYAAKTELRRRATQAEHTRAAQEVARLKAESEALKELTKNNLSVKLTPDQELELEGLKHTDPEEWRSKINQYEADARANHTKKVDESVEVAAKKGEMEAELERRKIVLEQYKEQNPGFDIDDDVITNDIPPRFTKELSENTITFEGFLDKVRDYLASGRVVGSSSQASGEPNLSKIGGSSSPSQEAFAKSSQELYQLEIY